MLLQIFIERLSFMNKLIMLTLILFSSLSFAKVFDFQCNNSASSSDWDTLLNLSIQADGISSFSLHSHKHQGFVSYSYSGKLKMICENSDGGVFNLFTDGFTQVNAGRAIVDYRKNSLKLNNEAFNCDNPSLNESNDHSQHNMILLGEGPIFASHIVYKEPHNFQVLLEIKFDEETKSLYLASKADHSQALFIFLLDPIDIKNISTQEFISGSISYTDSAEQRHEVIHHVTVSRANFKVIYLDELPLSLARRESSSLSCRP
jgi:hypothetical protein